MTEPQRLDYMPTMDEAERFIKANQRTAINILLKYNNDVPVKITDTASGIDRLQSEAIAAAEAMREACCAAIRHECGPCNGTGHAEGIHEYECEYCGRPISAIRNLPATLENKE